MLKKVINEVRRLIPGFLELTDILEIEDFLLTFDIAKAFDSIYHVLLQFLDITFYILHMQMFLDLKTFELCIEVLKNFQ